MSSFLFVSSLRACTPNDICLKYYLVHVFLILIDFIYSLSLFLIFENLKTFTNFQKSAQRRVSVSFTFLQSFHATLPFSFCFVCPVVFSLSFFVFFAYVSMQIFLFPLFSYTKGNILDILFRTLASLLMKYSETSWIAC